MNMADAHNRSLKDFLELYNRLAYHCFDKCVSNFNEPKTTEEEMRCVNTCIDKCIFFNQRHMMVFVEHQNNKQKMAAKAAESQAALAASPDTQALGIPADTSPPTLESTEQAGPVPGSTAEPVALGGGNNQDVVPEKVSGLPTIQIVPQLAMLPSLKTSTSYAGKSIIDQFLNGSTDKLKFI